MRQVQTDRPGGCTFSDHNINGITEKVAATALDLLEVDKMGLDHIDRNILSTMIEKFKGGPVGLDTLAAAIGEDAGTLEDVQNDQFQFFYGIKFQVVDHTEPVAERCAQKPSAILNNLQEGDILFVDEIHRLNRQVEEVLYPAMEDYAMLISSTI